MSHITTTMIWSICSPFCSFLCPCILQQALLFWRQTTSWVSVVANESISCVILRHTDVSEYWRSIIMLINKKCAYNPAGEWKCWSTECTEANNNLPVWLFWHFQLSLVANAELIEFIITSAEEVKFSVCFVCLFVCLRTTEKLLARFSYTWWKSVAWHKEETITFWSGLESLGRYNDYFSLILTLHLILHITWRNKWHTS